MAESAADEANRGGWLYKQSQSAGGIPQCSIIPVFQPEPGVETKPISGQARRKRLAAPLRTRGPSAQTKPIDGGKCNAVVYLDPCLRRGDKKGGACRTNKANGRSRRPVSQTKPIGGGDTPVFQADPIGPLRPLGPVVQTKPIGRVGYPIIPLFHHSSIPVPTLARQTKPKGSSR